MIVIFNEKFITYLLKFLDSDDQNKSLKKKEKAKKLKKKKKREKKTEDISSEGWIFCIDFFQLIFNLKHFNKGI